MEKDITAAALRYVILAAVILHAMLLNLCRTFTIRSPTEKDILEGVSIMCTFLKLGTITIVILSMCVFIEMFFNFLFEDRGSRVCCRHGKMNNRSDFNNR